MSSFGRGGLSRLSMSLHMELNRTYGTSRTACFIWRHTSSIALRLGQSGGGQLRGVICVSFPGVCRVPASDCAGGSVFFCRQLPKAGLQEPGDGIVIALDDLHSFMASGNGEIRLVWGDQKRMERIRVYGAASVETAIREAVRSCGRQIA